MHTWAEFQKLFPYVTAAEILNLRLHLGMPYTGNAVAWIKAVRGLGIGKASPPDTSASGISLKDAKFFVDWLRGPGSEWLAMLKLTSPGVPASITGKLKSGMPPVQGLKKYKFTVPGQQMGKSAMLKEVMSVDPKIWAQALIEKEKFKGLPTTQDKTKALLIATHYGPMLGKLNIDVWMQIKKHFSEKMPEAEWQKLYDKAIESVREQLLKMSFVKGDILHLSLQVTDNKNGLDKTFKLKIVADCDSLAPDLLKADAYQALYSTDPYKAISDHPDPLPKKKAKDVLSVPVKSQASEPGHVTWHDMLEWHGPLDFDQVLALKNEHGVPMAKDDTATATINRLLWIKGIRHLKTDYKGTPMIPYDTAEAFLDWMVWANFLNPKDEF
jgi:hypothetical protein